MRHTDRFAPAPGAKICRSTSERSSSLRRDRATQPSSLKQAPKPSTSWAGWSRRMKAPGKAVISSMETGSSGVNQGSSSVVA